MEEITYCGLCDDRAVTRCDVCKTPLCRDHRDSVCDSAIRHCQ
jgi:hypothetical protein